MVRKISGCFISLLLSLLLTMPAWAQQQQRGRTGSDQRPVATTKEKTPPEKEYPFFNGIYVGLDLWGPGSKLLGSDAFSTEVSAYVDLKHRYLPVIELGYGKTDAWNDNGINYKSNSPYLRIGMDYNTLYKKAHGHMILVGLRYGISNPTYDIRSLGVDDPIYGGSYNPNIEDDIWGGSVPYNHSGMKCTMHWLEFCVGLRAHVWKSLYMGWSLRLKYKLSASPDTYGDPWYVPGFGNYASNTMGVSYSIIYKLPF
ncbi:MAG: hypothetical protein IJ494_04870 [Bacteroides sp.]|nr:hypothetical protein [Bacteroides sp.]